MANYSADKNSFDVFGFGADSKDADIVWYGSSGIIEPPSPPDIDDPICKNFIITKKGHDEFGKLASGDENAYIKEIRIGVGGWKESELIEETIGTGDGSNNFSGNTDFYPIVPGSAEIELDSFTETDNGNGVFTGEQSGGVIQGTIDYNNGEINLTFGFNVFGGDLIKCNYRMKGGFSDILEQNVAVGDGTSGPYTGNIKCVPVYPGFLTLSDWKGNKLIDDGDGNLSDPYGGSGTGTVDYDSGDLSFTFSNNIVSGYNIRASFKVEGIGKRPSASQDCLDAEKSGEYVFKKVLGVDTETVPVFQGVGSGKVRFRIFLDTDEGNDDGEGNNPWYYEGGLYSGNGELIIYFTFPKIKKDNTKTIDFSFDLAR